MKSRFDCAVEFGEQAKFSGNYVWNFDPVEWDELRAMSNRDRETRGYYDKDQDGFTLLLNVVNDRRILATKCLLAS